MNELIRRTRLYLAPDADTGGDTPKPEGGGGPSVAELQAKIAELEGRAGKATELEKTYQQLRDELSVVVNGSADDAKAEAATRSVLRTIGWDSARIEEHIRQLKDTSTPEPRKAPGGKTPTPEDETEEEGELQKELKETREEIRRVQELQGKQERGRLEGVLRTEVQQALTGHKELGTLVETLYPVETGDSKAKAKRDDVLAELQSMTDRRARELLGEMRAQRGPVQETWFQEAATKAAKEVHARYLKLVPDLSKRLKSSDGEDGFEFLKGSKPIEPVKYQKGKPVADQLQASRDWAVDAIARAASTVKSESF